MEKNGSRHEGQPSADSKDAEDLSRLNRRLGRALDEALEAQARAEKAQRLKSAYLAALGQDLRAPLATVLSCLDGIASSGAKPEQVSLIAAARQAAQGLVLLQNDLMDIFKAEAGGIDLLFVDFDPRQVAAGALAAFRQQAEVKGVALDMEVAADVPQRLRGDPMRLHQILSNLVSNAVRHTDEGVVRVCVERDSAYSGPVVLMFSVSDTGPGMSPERRDALFELLRSGNPTAARRLGGTGLGLAVCRALVRLMGGDIWVHSLPRQGARFVFTAFFGVAEGDEAQAGAPPPVDKALPPLRILLADDSEYGCFITRACLTGTPFSLHETHSGGEALEMFRANAYDLVLADADMPVLDGLRTIKAMRALEAETGRPRAAMALLAPAGLFGQEQGCLAAGCDGRIEKPFSRDELLKTILDLAGPAEGRPGEDA